MKAFAVCLLLASCASPGQATLSRTPTATTKANPSLAPAASDSDADREQLIQSNQDMQDAQNAHKEAAQGSAAPPKPLTSPGSTPTVKPKTQPASPDKPPATTP